MFALNAEPSTPISCRSCAWLALRRNAAACPGHPRSRGDLGLLVLEDLGDVTLQAHLGAAPSAEHNRLYRQAVSFIEAMQRRGAELASPEYPPYGIAFDVEKLLWELEFFTKHYLGAYAGR